MQVLSKILQRTQAEIVQEMGPCQSHSKSCPMRTASRELSISMCRPDGQGLPGSRGVPVRR